MKPGSALARIMSMRATEERKPRRHQEPELFNPIIEALRNRRGSVVIKLLDEPTDDHTVKIEYEGQARTLRLSGSILWELKKWACMGRPLKNTMVTIRFRNGAVAPEVDVTPGPSTSTKE